MLSRRQILAGVGASAVLGFNTRARAWSACGEGALKRLPRLDGVVLTDPSSLAGYATDAGNIVHQSPIAVLRPGSVADVQKMVRFCAENGIKVAARGQGHTNFGQSLTQGGLIVDMGSLARVHSIRQSRADVDAGIRWNTLLSRTVAVGATPPVLTGYLGLSVGGTLSVGGISSTNRAGAQVDNVSSLDVVTGTGELRTCSVSQNSDLFELALAGLGQCGIITRAVVNLEPAPTFVRVYTIDYASPAAFFADLRELLRRGELEDAYNFGVPDQRGGWIYQLTLAKRFEPHSPPKDAFLLRGLSVPASAATTTDMPFVDYALRVDAAIDFFRQIGLWDGVSHPWFDVFLPERSVESYVTDVVRSLAPEDVGQTGFLLLFPQRRSVMQRPLLRLPSSNDWVYLFDILTAASAPGPNPEFNARMLRRNRTLFDRARAVGGTRYPIGALTFSHSDWVLHYGSVWSFLARGKERFDPARILTPGPGIFHS